MSSMTKYRQYSMEYLGYGFIPTSNNERMYGDVFDLLPNIIQLVGRRGTAVRTPDFQSREPGFESSCCRFENFAISVSPVCQG